MCVILEMLSRYCSSLFFSLPLVNHFYQAIDEIVAKKTDDPGSVSVVIGALLVEAVARVVKNELNLLMREKAKELGLPLEVFFFFFFFCLVSCLCRLLLFSFFLFVVTCFFVGSLSKGGC